MIRDFAHQGDEHDTNPDTDTRADPQIHVDQIRSTIMKFDLLATMNSDANRPIDHDVCLQRLPELAADLPRDFIRAGTPYYHSRDSLTWVSYPKFAVNVGLGIPLYDPTCEDHVPPEAIAKPVFLPELITDSVAAAYSIFRAARDGARKKGPVPRALRDEHPPRPCDLRVDWFPDDELSVTRLINAGLLAFPGDRCWWVIGAEAQKLLPPMDDPNDLSGPDYDNPEAWVDHDALDRFNAEHRRYWPELYTYQHPEWLAWGYQQPAWNPEKGWA